MRVSALAVPGAVSVAHASAGSPRFVAGEMETGFLDRSLDQVFPALETPPLMARVASYNFV